MKYWYIDYQRLTLVAVVRNSKEFYYLYIIFKNTSERTIHKMYCDENSTLWHSYFPETGKAWRKNGGKEYKTLTELLSKHSDIFISLL